VQIPQDIHIEKPEIFKLPKRALDYFRIAEIIAHIHFCKLDQRQVNFMRFI